MSSYEQKKKFHFCAPRVALTFEGVCEALQWGLAEALALGGKAVFFALAMRWMTGGELVPKLDPILSTQPGSSADVEDVAWAGKVTGLGDSRWSASGRLQ